MEIKRLKDHHELSNYHYFSPMLRNWYVYKYMDVESAILCLSNSNIQFVEPTEWKDKYEARFYNADYSLIESEETYPKRLYACCFTLNTASEAAWNTYSYNNTGLKSRCAQFKIDLKELRKCLSKYCVENDFNVYEGVVNYNMTDGDIDNLHYKGTDLYRKFFSPITFEKYLSLLLLKRGAYYYEKEVRFFLIPNSTAVNKKLYPAIEWKNIIKEVIVDENCSDVEIEVLKKYCIKAGLMLGEQKGKIKMYRSKIHQMKEKQIVIGTKRPLTS